MKRWMDDTKAMPFTCRQCKHNLVGGMTCKAFDIIPEQFADNAVLHNSVVEGQKGSYVFEASGEQEVRRDYYFAEG